jgi:hypothetical protein
MQGLARTRRPLPPSAESATNRTSAAAPKRLAANHWREKMPMVQFETTIAAPRNSKRRYTCSNLLQQS